MIDRHAAEKKLSTIVTKVYSIRDKRDIYTKIMTKFNIPVDMIESLFSLKREVDEATPFEIFSILYFMDKENLGKYFTEKEIEEFSEMRYELNEKIFPIKIPVIRVTDTQWIGTTSMSQLMAWRRAGLIKYQEGQQRVFKLVKSGNIEVKRIAVNRVAVGEIKDSMLKGVYIPDDITINLPDNISYEFKDNKLIIDEAPDGFNLLDGFHRWLAMTQIANENNDFDIPMEIRIVQFDEDTAQQYIFQKDQKTQMKKVDSASYNKQSVWNRIINSLNINSNFAGEIRRVGGLVSYQDMLAILPRLIPLNNDETEAKFVVRVSAMLRDGINYMTEANNSLLQERINTKRLCILLYTITQDIPDKEKINVMQFLEQYAASATEFKITGTKIRIKAINILNNGLEEYKKVRK